MLLSEPLGWSVGDAAAVIVANHGRPDRLRDRVVNALLAEGASVLELRAGSSCGGDAAPVPALFAALRAVRLDAGAGLVVAVGQGSGAETVLRAESEAVALAHLGPAIEDRYAAAVGIGQGAVVVVPGRMPKGRTSLAATRRAALLCETLGRAMALEDRSHASGRLARGCLTALVPDGAGQPAHAVAAADP